MTKPGCGCWEYTELWGRKGYAHKEKTGLIIWWNPNEDKCHLCGEAAITEEGE
jgi:hypothetical protein